MKDFKKVLMQYLQEHHPGVPDDETAMELIESFMQIVKKFLLKENEFTLEGIGKLELRRISGAEKKRDARYDITYSTSPRRVLKLIVSDNFKKLINSDRKPNVRID